MSLFDQRQLLASIHPFDLLSQQVLESIMERMDIAYYPKQTVLIAPNALPEHLYIIIKGSVYEWLEDELTNAYGSGDSFDADTLIYGKTDKRFVVEEDLICYELPKQDFIDLIQDQAAFKHFYLEDFVTKHQQLKKLQQQNDLTPFMVARVSDIFLHAPCVVDPGIPILDAVRAMEAMQQTTIIVGGETPGIVTDTNLRRKVLLGDTPSDAPVSAIMASPLITIERRDFLFNALLLFTTHNIKRIAVTEEGKIVGVLKQLDLLSYFANHSHLVATQIEKAESIETLKSVGETMVNLIRSLHSKGVKVRYISKLVNALNAKMYGKIFELCVAPEDRESCCLVVMGSEGRGEQMLRTDQDNALIIRDGCLKDFETEMTQFHDYLSQLGFPDCAGNVMVVNPYWRQSVDAYKSKIDGWAESMDEAALQAFTIFLDAQSVAGNSSLLEEVKAYLAKRFEGRETTLAHMAKAALSFETPLTLFSGLVVDARHHNGIDLKKGGIFAIVHGIRILALQKQIDATNTFERIKALNNVGVFDKTFAAELIEAYDTLLSIRLRTRLSFAESERQSSNTVNPQALDKLERDLLKDSFKVVNALKKQLTYHFHLNMVM